MKHSSYCPFLNQTTLPNPALSAVYEAGGVQPMAGYSPAAVQRLFADWWRQQVASVLIVRTFSHLSFMETYTLHRRGWFGFLSTIVLIAIASSSSPAVAQVPSSGTLRPGDVIRLRIWREPDLSGDFAVDETGTVVFPRIGALRVVEESPESLKARLVKAYEAFLNHSSINITLLRRLQVLGAVRNPGLYPVDATMTVADALALAGGTTPQGDPDRIELVRDGQRIAARLSANTPITGSQLQSGDQIFVPERSWVSRNAGVVAAGITATVSLVVALLRM